MIDTWIVYNMKSVLNSVFMYQSLIYNEPQQNVLHIQVLYMKEAHIHSCTANPS